MPKQTKSEPAYKLRNTAAKRARRLFYQMGYQGQMEADPRYRENMLGSEFKFPMSSVAELPMRMLNNARALASDDDAAETRREAQKKED